MSELKNAEIDIAVLTETKKKGMGSEKWGYYDLFYSGVTKDQRAQQGVAIVIRKTLRRHITSWEAINQRLIKMNITIKGSRIAILGVYGINEDALVNSKDTFFEQLNDEIIKVGTSREIILLGDFNSRVGWKLNNKVVGTHGENTRNDNGTRLITTCTQNNLKILNGFYPHRDIHKYTWIQQTRNLKSIIDYSIVRQRTKIKIQDVRVARGPSCGTDHHLLKVKAILPNRYEKEKEHIETNQLIKKVRYNLDSLNHESVKLLYKKRLDQKLEMGNFENTEEHYEHIKRAIHLAAEEALGKCDENHKGIKPYCTKCKYELEEEHRTGQSRQFYKDLKTMKGNTTNSPRYIKDDAGQLLTDTEISRQWRKYFEQLLNTEKPTTTGQQRQYQCAEPEIPGPTLAEVKSVISSLKNHKAPGPDGIQAELLKKEGEKLHLEIYHFIREVWEREEIPKP
ncbi:uncharacterized protein [Diabrotica undecimpunctata]|uniref:uncharacterized protein n=1 Tax=Diabrotica undecimpunctata TaxID=50387 RepID=UPI003B639B7B